MIIPRGYYFLSGNVYIPLKTNIKVKAFPIFKIWLSKDCKTEFCSDGSAQIKDYLKNFALLLNGFDNVKPFIPETEYVSFLKRESIFINRYGDIGVCSSYEKRNVRQKEYLNFEYDGYTKNIADATFFSANHSNASAILNYIIGRFMTRYAPNPFFENLKLNYISYEIYQKILQGNISDKSNYTDTATQTY